MDDSVIYGEPEDHDEYIHFTGRQRIDAAMHTLQGLLKGIAADGSVDDEEVKSLIIWVSRHREFENRHPFNEVIPKIKEVVRDGIVDEDEREDLIWLAEKFTTDEAFYDTVTSDLQRLQGFLAGIIADNKVTTDEVKSLSDWLEDHAHLRSCWPYDEIDALILNVLQDGVVDPTEEQILLNYFSDFTYEPNHKSVGSLGADVTITGICAACPEIEFTDRLFCFTGTSERGPRDYLASVVADRGGRFHKRVRNDTNFLVVGAGGNPCWAYACYGRKVEDAIDRRRKGQRIVVVHENDFWDAVTDGGHDI